MKKIVTGLIAVFLLLCLNGVHAQITTTSPDQLKLNQTFVGIWKAEVGKDTIDLWEVQQYGNPSVSTGYRMIKDKKSFQFGENWVYSSKEDNFKGFIVWANGGYGTWIAKFTSEKKYSGNFVKNLNPEAIIVKFEITFDTPINFTIVYFNADGVKESEVKMVKVK
jgi:hypothetical protein